MFSTQNYRAEEEHGLMSFYQLFFFFLYALFLSLQEQDGLSFPGKRVKKWWKVAGCLRLHLLEPY